MGKVLSCPKTHLCWINTNQRRVRLEEDKESSSGGAQCIGGVTKKIDQFSRQSLLTDRCGSLSLARSLARSRLRSFALLL